MKRIYVKQEILQEAVNYLNNEITFFGFLSHTKAFLKDLLLNPAQADVDNYLKDNGLDRKSFIEILLTRNILEKETSLNDDSGKDKFVLSFKVPKRNFERKMRRLYSSLFEKNEITDKLVNETDCGGAMQGGGTNPDAGQFIQPLQTKNGTTVQRRRIYVTTEQINMLKETSTGDVGNYQYDVPLNFNNGNDPAFNHENMIAKGVPNKKIGIRKK